ncbi:hypothetical protein D3C71_1278910 [compost metagenome]
MVGARKGAVGDEDALLGLQLFDQTVHILLWRDLVGIAVDDEAGRRAGGEEGEVVGVGLRRNRHEALDFRTAHQKLHADPGAEGITGNPAALRIRMQALHPVESGSGVGKLASTMVEFALAAADRAEIEPERGEAALLEKIEQLIDDLVVHRAAELRMRMKDDRYRRALFLGGLITAFEATRRAVKNDFGHWYSGRVFSFSNRILPMRRLDELCHLF